jgi:hypothetical protein
MTNDEAMAAHPSPAITFTSLKTTLKLRGQGIFLSLLLLCSCATENSIHPRLPADVTMNKEAGRGGLVVVTLRLESGAALPFVVDTGSPWTFFEKSQESILGAPLDSGTLWILAGLEEERTAARLVKKKI